MDLIKAKLIEIIKLLQDMKADFDAAIANAPPGLLTFQMRGEKQQLMHMYLENGRRVRRGINRDHDMQKALAHKAFAQRAGNIAAENLYVLQNIGNQLVSLDPDEILKTMPPAYSTLPDNYFFDRENMSTILHLPEEDRIRILRHRKWGQEEYQASNYHPEWKKHKTTRGLKMRSKSEVLIMERLYHYGIDVRYEQVWDFGNERVAPDFTFEDEYGQLFSWEHLGMMNDPRYAAQNYEKLMKYYRHGFVLGKNLIVTFDRSGTIDMELIDFTIQKEIIPRL